MSNLLTVKQAANRLQVTPETVRIRLRNGALHGVKSGTLWRVIESSLFSSPTTFEVQTYEVSGSKRGVQIKSTGRVFEATLPAPAVLQTYEPNADAFFPVPSRDEINRRLTALRAFDVDPSSRTERASQLDSNAVAQGYDDRNNRVMEGHR